MDDLERLLLAHRMQQQSGGMMQRPPIGGMPSQMPPMPQIPYNQPQMMQPGGMQNMNIPQPPNSAISGVGQMPYQNAPFGSQVKDYTNAIGSMGLPMAQGISAGGSLVGTLAKAGGPKALQAFASSKGMTLEQLLRMLAGSSGTGQAGGMMGNAGLAGANQMAIIQGMNQRY